MIPITFNGAGMLAGLATMLECMGYHTDDKTIALGMEAPYLFVRDQDSYKAGACIYQPHWLNLYLHPHGLHMSEESLAQGDVCAYLRAHQPAMLPIMISRTSFHPVVFTGYVNGRYEFVNVKPFASPEPDSFSLTAAMLKRRLSPTVIVYSLTSCEAQPVDFVPLLLASLDNLVTYQEKVLETRKRIVTRQEFAELRTQLLRALMQDMQPLMALIGDYGLAEELRRLNHDYRHIFVCNDGETCALYDRLPKSSIKHCITWIRENIFDRLYELGVSDEIIESKMRPPKKSC